MAKRCPDIELIEVTEEKWFNTEPRVIAPNLIRIDGREYYVEKGSVRISGGNDDEAVKVQLTLFPGSLTVKQELEQ